MTPCTTYLPAIESDRPEGSALRSIAWGSNFWDFEDFEEFDIAKRLECSCLEYARIVCTEQICTKITTTMPLASHLCMLGCPFEDAQKMQMMILPPRPATGVE